MTGIIILWLILSVLFASLGRNRKIGFVKTLIICLLLSPIIGLIFVLLSEKEVETLMKLKIEHDSGTITKEEYATKVREISPNTEDKADAKIGYLIIAAIILIIYLYNQYL